MSRMRQHDSEKASIREDFKQGRISPSERDKRKRELNQDSFQPAIDERQEDYRNLVEDTGKPSDWRG